MLKRSASYKIGDSIKIENKSGTIRFVGKTVFAPGIWIGIELDQPEGIHDGKLYGQRYFECNKRHGIFVRTNSQSYIQSNSKKQAKLEKKKKKQDKVSTKQKIELDQKESLSSATVFSPQAKRRGVTNKQELVKRLAFRKYIISQYSKEKDQIKTKIKQKETILLKKGKKGKKLTKNVNQKNKIFTLKQRIKDSKEKEKEVQKTCIKTENILENCKEELESRSEDALRKRFLELELQRKILKHKVENAEEKKIKLEQSNKHAKGILTNLMKNVKAEKDEVSKIYQIRMEEIKQIEKEKKEILKKIGNTVSKTGMNIFQLADRINTLNKSISSGQKKIVKLENSRNRQNEKRSHIEQENKNRKSQWISKLMDSKPEIFDFREKLTPILNNQGLGRLKTTVKFLKRNILNSEDILQLIMQHYEIERQPSIREFIEKQTGIKYIFQEQPESMLVSFLKIGCKKDNPLWDLTQQQEDNSLEVNRGEELNARRNIVLSLDDKDINIWEEPANNPQNIRIENQDLENYQNGDFFSSIYLSNINKLIEHLIHPIHFDKKFIVAFLIIHTNILKSEHLFLKIVQRYRVPPFTDKGKESTKTKSEEMKKEEIEMEKKYNEMKISIQKITIIVLEIWVKKHFSDFGPILIENLIAFLENEVKQNYHKESQILIKKIQTLQENKNKTSNYDSQSTNKAQPPTPVIPKSLFSVNFQLSDVKPIEMARQITLFFQQIFLKIKPSEIIEQAHYTKKNTHKTQNIKNLIDKFNDFSSYIAERIVRPNTLRQRAAQFVHWIKVAVFLREMNNFDSLIMAVGGIGSSSCSRLKVTKSEVSKNHWKSLKNLKNDISQIDFYKNYRKLISTCELPALPYFGVFKKDLVYILDGSTRTVEGLINFRQRKHVYNIVRQIKKFQKVRYNFISISQIQELFKQKLSNKTSKQLFEISLQNEPRGSTRTSLH
ncbi:guanine nucleotide exchange factor [Anaeramoeba flamelloides]|uniref:Guanine nucleotide exchange factor n=1 Tax=Anaeramoeba flamelloides TaxID=1746091 RepID=A0AAV7ZXL1_9EUKA|nr:guanine nucleotide exchange factor [Anaeramoeba flamelloides]